MKKGFTLIELMIVIAIIAIIASIAIPGILSARRASNASAALANVKSLTTSLTTYAQDQDAQTYPSSTNNFGAYYSHIDTKGGYNFCYQTNADEQGKGEPLPRAVFLNMFLPFVHFLGKTTAYRLQTVKTFCSFAVYEFCSLSVNQK